jgi:hypothetical protein
VGCTFRLFTVELMMPILNLRTSNDTLIPLARFQVFGVMACPNDRQKRLHLMNQLETETTGDEPAPPRPAITELLEAVKQAMWAGSEAGAILRNIIQLQRNGLKPSFNRAHAILGRTLPEHVQLLGPEWHADRAAAARHPRHRNTVSKSFREYLSVSHLWAALVFAEETKRADIWPGSNETLPRFLGFADAFARAAADIRWYGKDRAAVLPRRIVCRVQIPEPLKEHHDVSALRLDPELEQALNAYNMANKLY